MDHLLFRLQKIVVLLLILGLTFPLIGYSCFLHGHDSGVCTRESKDYLWRRENMPFCGQIIDFPVCVPKAQSLPVSREYPDGKWKEHTVKKKDDWVFETYNQFIQNRTGFESNKRWREERRNERGEEGRIAFRFYKNPDCKNAYKNLFCWTNFPRCDSKKDLTFPMCRSTCENYFISCEYERDLWRCGKSKYFNGYEPEIPLTMESIEVNDSTTGEVETIQSPVYLRDYFPGQPWRENKYSLKGNELRQCTPAVTGSAASFRVRRSDNILSIATITSLLGLTLVFLY